MQTMKARAFCTAFLLAFLVLFTPAANAANWIDSADVSWYDEGKSEFTLTSEAQFAGLAKLTLEGKSFKDKTVSLGADLDLGSKEWTAVGAFEGLFDGRNRSITLGTGNTTALFSDLLKGGILRNLHLSGTVNLAPKGASPVMQEGFRWADGTLLGVNRGIVENCSFKGKVRYVGSEGVVRALGGLVGCNPQRLPGNPSSIIRGCRVSGALEMAPEAGSASSGVPLVQVLIGGIAGINLGDIEDSVFEGMLNRTMGGGSIVAGGIAGGLDGCFDILSGGSYRNCFASFDMKSSVPMQEAAMMTAMGTPDTTCLGGIVGRLYDQTEIENCRARAELEYQCGIDNVCAGGILGFGFAKIINGVFEGNVTIAGTPMAPLIPEASLVRAYGGVAGLGAGLICNSFAKGTVTGPDGAVGGIAGYAFGKVENCSAACNVSSEGDNANVGALVGNNQDAQGAVSNCRWVSGLGADKAIGAGDKLDSTDVVAAESALPATSVAMIPWIGLTENKTASVKAEVYPLDAFNGETVSLKISPLDENILKVESDHAGMAVVRGVKKGTSGLKLSCNGLLGDTSYYPASFVTVRLIRLASLSLSPKVIELAQKDQSAEIHMAIAPDAGAVSYLPKWTFSVLEGTSAAADDIELMPTADGLGAAVTLVRPVSGAKYRVLAEAVDGSGLSDDVIVMVKYNPPAPVSPDVSPDVPAPTSPDVPAPTSPDIEPGEPEVGIAPRLPDGVPAGVGASKPAFFGGSEAAALKNAAAALSDTGLEAKDLAFDPDTGIVRLQSRVAREVARKVLPEGATVKRVRTLPVLSATLPQGANVAAVGLELTGRDLMAKKASEVELLKATGPDTGALLKWSGKPEEFGDGRFTVLDGSGRGVDELQPRSRYVLTVFIGDGGKYDLDGEANGKVVDPLALLSLTGGSAPEHQPGPDGKDGGGGGCNAGLGWLLLLAAVVPVALRRQ